MTKLKNLCIIGISVVKHSNTNIKKEIKMQLLLLNNFSATIDIVALVLLTAYALYGLIRGFAKTFFSVFGSLIGILLALLIAPSVVNFLQNKFLLVDTMSNNFGGVVQSLLSKTLIRTPIANVTQDSLKGIAGFIANAVLSLKDNANVSPDATVGKAIAYIFAYYVLLIICVIILFIVLKIIFFIISEIVKKAYNNKAIASIDRTLGVALGVVNGIFNIEIIIIIVSILPIPRFQQIIIGIDGTVFTKFIQNINLYQILLNNVTNNNIIGKIL